MDTSDPYAARRAERQARRLVCIEWWAVEAVYTYITESYASYRANLRASEPRLTVTILRDYFAQASTPTIFSSETPTGQRAIIQAAIGRLVRAKRITSSLTYGERKNTEVRAYEPT